MKAQFFTLLAATSLLAACSTTNDSVATAQNPTPSHSGSSHQDKTQPASFQLPPGWTEADMQACAKAATPGAEHAWLTKGNGTWKGTSTMWMAPGSEPSTSPVTAKCSSVMDGRYTRCEYSGEMPGMGPFSGLGHYGYDNVSGKFVSTWMDNMGTGIMNGTGKQTADGTGIDWTFNYNCPIGGPSTMREMERHTSDDSWTLEMHGKDPKSGKEFKMMLIEMKRVSG